MKKALSSNSGFTFIEIMVVVVIIGILATLVGTAVIGRIDEANIAKAKSDIATLQGSLQLYKLDNGNYPTTEQGLDALVKPPAQVDTTGEMKTWKEGGYIEGGRLPLDSWKNQYQYLSPGVNNPNYDLWSMGKDGESGNEDDIQSWNLDKAWK